MRLDINDQRYRDIEVKLLDLAIKFNLTKDMAFEVGEKHDACEEALMRYHHEKMKEINRQLGDFWKMTYKGSDIDAIEIRSDVEKTQ